jgi:dynein light intermediate chain 1, cytosolic
MIGWRDRGRGGNALAGGGSSSTAEGDVSLPLGPGEWEEALGLPLCVVCQNVWVLPSTTETLLTISIGRPN